MVINESRVTPSRIVIVGGVKISPEELDEILAGYPGLVEGAVVGYPDDVMGERICAVVVPKPGAELGIDHILHHIDLIETGSYQTLSREFLAVNPAGLVPLLVQVPDDVERTDLAAALRRERDPMTHDQDLHAASDSLISSVTLTAPRPSR